MLVVTTILRFAQVQEARRTDPPCNFHFPRLSLILTCTVQVSFISLPVSPWRLGFLF